MSTAELPISNNASRGISCWRDNLGIVASVGCAIHCAAMPFVIAYLPMLGLSFLADEAFHKWMALICFLIAIAAFLPGLRNHGSWVPIGIGAVGLVAITFAAFGLAGECCPSCETVAAQNQVMAGPDDLECHDCEHCSEHNAEFEQKQQMAVSIGDNPPSEKKSLLSVLAPWITPFGGLLLVSAHLLNRRYGCLCGCCETDEKQVALETVD